MIKTVVIGAAGRMGKMLVKQVLADPELELSGAAEMPTSPAIGHDAGTVAGVDTCGVTITDSMPEAVANADAIIDFSAPESTLACAKLAAEKNCCLVIGTTGLTDSQSELIRNYGKQGARIVLAPNMSVGINLLLSLCSRVAATLWPDYDMEVVEMHHNQKKDAPSGTAVKLAETLAEATGMSYSDDARHGREGHTGARPRREIGVHALRGGDVVGDHTVVFATEGERIELTHKASSRETFAKGALRAVKFLTSASPGIYDMQDVLGTK